MKKNAENIPLYMDILNKLKRRICQGYYSTKLPSIRLLAQDYSVSESTIKKLLDQLKQQNYLYGYQGKGVYINENYAHEHLNKLAFFLPENKKTNPFYQKIIHFLLDLLKPDNSIGLLFLNTIEQVKADVDSIGILILIEPNNAALVDQIANYIIPERIVMLNSILNDQISFVISDNYLSGYLGMEYLYKKNHRRIAIATTTYGMPVDYSVFEKRLEGANVFFVDHKLTPPLVITVEDSNEGGRNAAVEILASGGFTAVYCMTDIIALGVLKYCRENSIIVPEQLSVLGFGNIAEAAHQSPPLTTYEENTQDIIRSLSQICSNKLAGVKYEKSEVKIPAFLIERNSVAENCLMKNNNYPKTVKTGGVFNENKSSRLSSVY